MEESQKNQVRCTVENCHYNNKRTCQAESIEINPMGDGVAETCDGTNCSTFQKHNARY